MEGIAPEWDCPVARRGHSCLAHLDQSAFSKQKMPEILSDNGHRCLPLRQSERSQLASFWALVTSNCVNARAWPTDVSLIAQTLNSGPSTVYLAARTYHDQPP